MDESTPSGVTEQLLQRFQDSYTANELSPAQGITPLLSIVDLVGCDKNLAAVVAADNHVVIVDGRKLPMADLAEWKVFLHRFSLARAPLEGGLAVLFLAPKGFSVEGQTRVEWAGRLKRIDAIIWAEFHVPSGRSTLFQDLAVNLATELCGWRLDLIADLVTQREEDIVHPYGWMSRNLDRASSFEGSFGTRTFSCPLHLSSSLQGKECDQRIWKAQLASIFPWIEEHRIRIVERYKKFLRIDDRLRQLKVFEVENIELGALTYQLRQHVPRNEFEHMEALASMRNDLAHRKPIDAQKFKRALEISDTLR
ncbi:hypothetical protein [Pseudotabrizicola alkalilacus]|uniref:hypothetical protein n=1 Tax=Pseudotabrizicola alkalilacus TaxID=2305252 RepID=UPI0011C0F3FB|nr:hypothetical protein [Pseudotabrizicola alkalilacus]